VQTVLRGGGHGHGHNAEDVERGYLDAGALPALVPAELRPVLSKEARDTGSSWMAAGSSISKHRDRDPSSKTRLRSNAAAQKNSKGGGHTLDEWTQSTLEALIKLSGGVEKLPPKRVDRSSRSSAEVKVRPSHNHVDASEASTTAGLTVASSLPPVQEPLWETSEEEAQPISEELFRETLLPAEAAAGDSSSSTSVPANLGSTLQELHDLGIGAFIEPGSEAEVDADEEIAELLEHVKQMEKRLFESAADAEKESGEAAELEASFHARQSQTSSLRQTVKDASQHSMGLRSLLDESRLRHELGNHNLEAAALQAENDILRREIAKLNGARQRLEGDISSVRRAVAAKQEKAKKLGESLRHRYVDNELMREDIEKLEAVKARDAMSPASSDIAVVEEVSESQSADSSADHHEALGNILCRALSSHGADKVTTSPGRGSSEAAVTCDEDKVELLPVRPEGAKARRGRPGLRLRRNIEQRVAPGEAYLATDSEDES